MSIIIDRQSKGYRLEAKLWLPRSAEDVFNFFAVTRNLEETAPPALRFKILGPDNIVMGRGTRLDYRLWLYGLPVYWQSEITAWEPPYRFVDQQRRGPYRWWTHEHTFAENEDGTLMLDRVNYGVPGGALVHRIFVAHSLRKIFEFRARRMRDMMLAASGSHDAQAAQGTAQR
jgi:ligand-binding SRPBCC domain-containing protein